MEAEARYTWVGAGVLLLVVALVAAVLWLRNVGRAEDFRHYVIHFEQQALDGLQVGADVSLRGIKVGRVEDYALAGDKVNRVRVVIRLDRRVPVHTSTVAVVTRNFVTGIAGITLVTRDPPGPLLTEAPEGEAYPLIAEGRSDIDEIAGRVNRIGDMAAQALANLNDVLNPDNRKAVAEAVSNVRDLTAALNQRMAALDRSLADVSSAAVRFGRASTSLAGSVERITLAAERGGQRLEPVLEETERTLADARRAMQRIADATEALQRQTAQSAGRLERTATSIDDQLGAALVDLRLTLDSASRTMDRLREPRSALMGPPPGPLGPGEVRP